MSTEKNEYIIETPDLYFSAFLMAKECTIINTEESHDNRNKKVTFTFDTTNSGLSVKLLTDAYFNVTDESRVPALVYQEKIRALKTRCYIKSN